VVDEDRKDALLRLRRAHLFYPAATQFQADVQVGSSLQSHVCLRVHAHTQTHARARTHTHTRVDAPYQRTHVLSICTITLCLFVYAHTRYSLCTTHYFCFYSRYNCSVNENRNRNRKEIPALLLTRSLSYPYLKDIPIPFPTTNRRCLPLPKRLRATSSQLASRRESLSMSRCTMATADLCSCPTRSTLLLRLVCLWWVIFCCTFRDVQESVGVCVCGVCVYDRRGETRERK
jgi:hypothetical protein